MTTDHLVVLLRGRLAGGVQRTRLGEYEFAYDDEYARTGRIPLSPDLPLIGGTRFKHRQVQAYLEGLLPENPTVRDAWAASLGTSDDAFDLLTGMGLDCSGAVQFVPEEGLADLAGRGLDYRKVADSEIGDRLRALRHSAASWLLPGEHWSLPGAQDKFTLARLSGAWHEARGSAASTHIVKPGVRQLMHQALLEQATMRVAADLGLPTARTEFREFDGAEAIIVRRFDRIIAQDGSVHRLHQVDFCQAMGRLPKNKYEERNGPSTEDLARMLRRESADPDVDVRRFSDAVLMNYVVGAPDGHSKNFALLYDPVGRARMAPLYDMSSAFAYSARGGGYDLGKAAMSIGGRRKFGEVLRKNFERHAVEMGMDASERLARAAEMADAVPDAFRAVLASIDHDGAAALAERLLPRLARHCSEIVGRVRPGRTSGAFE